MFIVNKNKFRNILFLGSFKKKARFSSQKIKKSFSVFASKEPKEALHFEEIQEKKASSSVFASQKPKETKVLFFSETMHFFVFCKTKLLSVFENNLFGFYEAKTEQNKKQSFSVFSGPKNERSKEMQFLANAKPKIFARAQEDREVVSITYEEIGLFPRSFSRVLDRFIKQVFSDVENLVIQEYRFYRYLFLTTLKCILILFFVPFLVNFFAKNYLVQPLTEYFWNRKGTEIFLNSYQQKRAFAELKDFEEKIYFESLAARAYNNYLHAPETFKYSISRPNLPDQNSSCLGARNNSPAFLRNAEKHKRALKQNEIMIYSQKPKNTVLKICEANFERALSEKRRLFPFFPVFASQKQQSQETMPKRDFFLRSSWVVPENQILSSQNGTLYWEQRLQEKTVELAIRYNNQSIEALTNFFADLISFSTLFYLLFALEIQINITKSFLLEVFFGLDDSKKSLLILLVTDLLVGYHSSNIWELFFEFLLNHYGLPESQTGIFLLVATLPVLLDVLFKYLIFRHLNRSSPATVATYHAMIE